MIHKNSIFTIAAIIALAASATPAADLHVGSGQTYTTIQSAINAAVNGDTVIVADGRWTRSGGYFIAGKSITLRSANGPEQCIIDRKLHLDDLPEGDTVVEGFTFLWGGIHIENATSPTIQNCMIYGGIHGIELDLGGAIVRNCRITGNTEDGISMPGDNYNTSMLRVENCHIYDNGGHGILAYDGRTAFPIVTIYDCNIHDNGGGGVWSWAILDVARCRFEGNGLCGFGVTSPDMVIRNCVVMGNCWRGVHLPGLGVSSYADHPAQRLLIENCTVAHNVGSGGIGGYAQNGGQHETTVTNSIVWDNRLWDSPTGQINVKPDVSYVVKYSNVEGGYDGEGNMDELPSFVDSDKDDYRLLRVSPCINAGDPNYVPRENDTDADGRPRVLYERLDIGAYEFNGSYDLQGDGIMNLADFVLFAPFWMRSDCDGTNSWCDWSDFNADGQVGSDELVLLADHWLLGVKVPLVGYWAFDETHGVVAGDSSGFANDGTLINMDDSDWVGGRVGNALEFDGVNDFVEITGFAGLLGGQSRTVCAWIRTDTPGRVIIAWGLIGTPGGRWVFSTSAAGQLRVGIGGGFIEGTADVCDGEWHHVGVVAENDGSPNINEVKLYVDGLPDEPSSNTSDRTINTLAEVVTIGQFLDASFFEGTIDEVRIYDRALSAEEIAALAL